MNKAMIMATFFFVALALALHSTWAIAESPEQFLINVVKFDFQGDPAPRARRVTFSRRSAQAAYQKALTDADQIPEVYSLDMSPVVIVSNWMPIARHNYVPSKFCLDVQFSVLARSKGEGLPSWKSNRARKFVALDSPGNETVQYCAVEIGGQWMLVDPPIPRVEKNVVIGALQEELNSAERRIFEVKTDDPRAIKNMKIIRDSFASQLATLQTR